MNLCKNLYNININNKEVSNFIKFCYNILQDGNNILKHTKINIDIVNSLTNRLSNSWIPSNILNFIHKNKGLTYKVTSNINNINITLYFTCYESVNADKIFYYTNNILLVIYLFTINNTNICPKNIEIKLYLTPFKKIAPKNYNNILGINEINTGYSTIGCQNNTSILIYRKEEWFKVFIHELMHNLNLDFATNNIIKSKKKLFRLLQLNIKYEITETYAEIWARIINIAIAANIKTSDYNKYILHFQNLLEKEIIFSLQQASKVLKFVNNNDNYKENTNAYAYYVFTSALLYNYKDFLEWCDRNNKNIFNIKKTDKSINQFTELLISSLRKTNYQKLLTCIYNIENSSSLRMSRQDFLE